MTVRVPILCPTCQKPMGKVLDTRIGQGSIRRRRVCPDGHTMWTKEVPIQTRGVDCGNSLRKRLTMPAHAL